MQLYYSVALFVVYKILFANEPVLSIKSKKLIVFSLFHLSDFEFFNEREPNYYRCYTT